MPRPTPAIFPASPPAARRARSACWIGLALLSYWIMAVSVSPRLGVTADEVAHLTGGYAYWQTQDYRMHPDNGVLSMRLEALPLLALPLRFPGADTPGWREGDTPRVGREFFYGLGNPVNQMLLAARAVVALVGAALGWLIWRWAATLGGPLAGALALAFTVFCPTLLAHGGLATSDLVFATALVAVLTSYWRVLHVVTWPRLLAAALAGGAVLLAKMSGALAVPMLATLLVARWLRPAPLVFRLGGPPCWLRRPLARVVGTLAVTGALMLAGLALIWTAYGFRYQAAAQPEAGGRFGHDWSVVLGQTAPAGLAPDPELVSRIAPTQPAPKPSAATPVVAWAREHRLLPEAYLWGMLYAFRGAQSRIAFLNGEHSREGWPHFFPVAFALKTTPSVLLFTIIAAGLFLGALRGPPGRRLLWRALPLAVLFILYWGFALTAKLNIGHRHLLPIYPVVLIATGLAAARVWRSSGRLARFAVGVALFAHAADSCAARPSYLSYFNILGGGQAGGWRHLADSSSDWGQGLPELSRWLQARRAAGDDAPVFLTYFGADDPRWRGLDVIRFGDERNDHGPRTHPTQPRGGWYAIGATHFHRLYLDLPGPWTDRHEALYQDADAALRRWSRQPPTSPRDREILLRDAIDFELFAFARLCHFLRHREPDTVLGGSMLLFRLNDADLALALRAPLPVLNSATATPHSP